MERPEPADLLANKPIPPTCEHCSHLSWLVDILRQKLKRKDLEFDRLIQEKAELLDIAAHDLRLPVATIRIYTELLAEGISNQASPEVLDWVSSIQTVS